VRLAAELRIGIHDLYLDRWMPTEEDALEFS